MIKITDEIAISEAEIEMEFVRASGAGGQNVNKVSTAVKLRFDAAGSPSLPGDVRERLVKLCGKRITSEGILVIDARRYRTQEKNREDALARLIELIRKAAVKPVIRRKTRPPRILKEKRLEEKKRRGELKRARRVTKFSDD
ncbi:MAG: aminoacyl-tRNA hydrolase [Candidatus Schekmanbacteria bacterium]|nr:aminoacyl-tRNA hydrolase [Candidatus Schekmanbacteria bacterium]